MKLHNSSEFQLINPNLGQCTMIRLDPFNQTSMTLCSFYPSVLDFQWITNTITWLQSWIIQWDQFCGHPLLSKRITAEADSHLKYLRIIFLNVECAKANRTMSLTGVYSIEEKLQFESQRRDESDGLKNFMVEDHSPHSPHEWPRLRQHSPSTHQKEATPKGKRRDQLTTAEPMLKRKESYMKKSYSKLERIIAAEAGDGKPPFRFKLNDHMRKKLQERTPIISGYTLEHYYRYGKPPFMNFGYKRNVILTRYWDEFTDCMSLYNIIFSSTSRWIVSLLGKLSNQFS